jgi:hypothetical protein
MMGKEGSGRRKYDVIVKTHDDQIGMVAVNQLYHQGMFVTNREAVVEQERQQRVGETSRLPTYIRRTKTPEAAQEELIRTGIPRDMFRQPNGHRSDLERLVQIILDLEDNEFLCLLDGKFKVLRDTDLLVPQIPMPPARELVQN